MTKVHFKFDTKSTAMRITNAVKVAMPEVAKEVLEDCNFYAPQRNGVLIATSNISCDADGTRAVLQWIVPYAKSMFRGVSKRGKKFKYSKYPNPNAQSQWAHKAKSIQLLEWKRKFEKELRKNL